MRISLFASVFLFLVTILGCGSIRNKDYYRKKIMHLLNCEISHDFEVLEHKTSSGISSFEEIFKLRFSELEFNSIINCIDLDKLNSFDVNKFEDGFSLQLQIDYDEFIVISFCIEEHTVEYSFFET